MTKTVIVEVDRKGRVHLPLSIRRGLKTRRFSLSVRNGRLVMDPVKPATVRGKYKGLLKASIEAIEEAQERFVASNRFETVKDPLGVLLGKRPRFRTPIPVKKLEKLSEDPVEALCGI